MNPRPTFWFNILLLGDSKTGKTNLLRRLQNQALFDWDDTPKLTEIPEYSPVNYQINKKENVKLLIWDSSGRQTLKSQAYFLYKKAHCFFVVYDIGKRESFENLNKWFQDIEEQSKKGALIILIGNKCDKEDEREVSYEEGRSLAKEKEMIFFEVSAKTSESVQYALATVVKELYNMKVRDGLRIKNGVDSVETGSFSFWRSESKNNSLCSMF